MQYSFHQLMGFYPQWLQQEKRRTFTDHDLLTFLRTEQIFGEEAERFVNRMIKSGILDVVAHKTHGFRHLNIPDTALQLLYHLRRDDPVQAVRDAAKRCTSSSLVSQVVHNSA